MRARRFAGLSRGSGCTVAATLAVLVLLLAACSGPDDDAEATATQPAAATATTAAVIPTATSTSTSEPTATSTATPEPTATATSEPTFTPTSEPTATPTSVPPTATATATPIALPSGGAELRILGKAIEQIVPGNDAGSVLYAITSAGISRSTDSGITWGASGAVQEGQMVAALNEPNVLYAGDEGSCGRGDGDTPLVRSTDGGRTWETFAAGQGIRPLLVEAGMSSTVVGTGCLLQVSYDGGQSWDPVEGAVNYDAYAAASSDPDALDDHVIVLAASEGGTSLVWLIDMSGDSPVLDGEISRFFAHGAVAWLGDRIVIATSTDVRVTDDRGATWSSSRDGLEDATYSVDPLEDAIPPDEQGRGFGFSVVRIDPDDPDHIWIGGDNGAFRSTDGGQTWRPLGDSSTIDSLVLATDVQRVFVSSDGGTRVWRVGE
jgi:photosystem II stability/assembly factor-like uncharacterized protein